MAVCTYKKVNGEIVCERVPPELLDGQLGGGWTLVKADLENPKVAKPEVTEEVTREEADTNGTGKLSTEEIRQAAKDAGIEGWEKKRIKTLEAELWPTQK